MASKCVHIERPPCIVDEQKKCLPLSDYADSACIHVRYFPRVAQNGSRCFYEGLHNDVWCLPGRAHGIRLLPSKIPSHSLERSAEETLEYGPQSPTPASSLVVLTPYLFSLSLSWHISGFSISASFLIHEIAAIGEGFPLLAICVFDTDHIKYCNNRTPPPWPQSQCARINLANCIHFDDCKEYLWCELDV